MKKDRVMSGIYVPEFTETLPILGGQHQVRMELIGGMPWAEGDIAYRLSFALNSLMPVSALFRLQLCKLHKSANQNQVVRMVV
jgi:hypothetical protein